MKRYQNYRETAIPWLSQLPSHWGEKRAKYLFNKENRVPTETDEVITCFRDGTVTLRKNRRTTGFTESFKEIGYQGIKKGDLVIHQMDAFAGSTGVSGATGSTGASAVGSTGVVSFFISKLFSSIFHFLPILTNILS